MKKKRRRNAFPSGLVLKIFVKTVSAILVFPLLLIFSSCDRSSIYESSFIAMDTFMKVRICSAKDPEDIAGKIRKTVNEIEEKTSVTIKESDVYKFNESLSGYEISDFTAEIVRKSLEISKASLGAFDITTKPVSDLWEFSSGGRIPSEEEISKAIENIGYEKIKLEGNYLSKLTTEVRIDLGGVAKGYALGKVCEYLETEYEEGSLDYAIVNFGGNVGVVGKKNGDFSIGIRDPENEEGVYAKLTVDKGFVSVSGDYERFFEKDGIRYCHIIDPSNGMTVSGIHSVAVYSDDAMTGDALSTAFFVMGREKADDFLKKYGDEYGIFGYSLISDEGSGASEGLKNIYFEYQDEK